MFFDLAQHIRFSDNFMSSIKIGESSGFDPQDEYVASNIYWINKPNSYVCQNDQLAGIVAHKFEECLVKSKGDVVFH